jgi:tRNA G18 (ribose-2'-O)-methylase SpoU
MLRYFFHVIDGEELPDNVGTVLSNADEARAEAIVLSGAMLKAKGRRAATKSTVRPHHSE